MFSSTIIALDPGSKSMKMAAPWQKHCYKLYMAFVGYSRNVFPRRKPWGQPHADYVTVCTSTLTSRPTHLRTRYGRRRIDPLARRGPVGGRRHPCTRSWFLRTHGKALLAGVVSVTCISSTADHTFSDTGRGRPINTVSTSQ